MKRKIMIILTKGWLWVLDKHIDQHEGETPELDKDLETLYELKSALQSNMDKIKSMKHEQLH